MVMKILVLDDEDCVLDTMRDMLKAHGHDVDCVDNAPAAVRLLKKRAYDLILFDYVMPEKDGLWFLKNARLPSPANAVLMTGYGTPDLINRALEHGAAGYILKPFTMGQLMQHVEFYSKRKQTGRSKSDEALTLSTAQ